MRWLALAVVVLGCAAAPRRRSHPTLETIPAEAAAAIRREMRGFAITQLVSTLDSLEQIQYAATWYDRGARNQLTVSEGGNVIYKGFEVPVASVPAVVVDAATRYFDTDDLHYLQLTHGDYLVQKFRTRDGRRRWERLVFRWGVVFDPQPPDSEERDGD